MKIRCLIVDDEPPAQRLVASYCAQVPDLEVVGVCSSAVEAGTLLRGAGGGRGLGGGRGAEGERGQRIDLLFLDIKMPQLTGLDFIRSLAHPPKVILITAYREHALDGYELDIVDYLLKPVSLQRFIRAVAKAARLLEAEEPGESEAGLEAANKEAFLYFRVDKEMVKVMLDDILFVESRKEYVRLYLEGKRSLLVKQSISSLEKLLSPHRFVRVHRSYLVTMEKVGSYTATQIKIGEYSLPIGRLYKNAVEAALGR